MEDEKSYLDKREQNNNFLDTFIINVQNNSFDGVIDKLIVTFENEIKDFKNSNDDLKELNIYSIKKELYSLSEMKIIYSFKLFETNLKILLEKSYPKTNGNNIYKWDYLGGFLKTKNIKIKEIDKYKEINELRILNNTIKHSDSIITDQTKKFTEFIGKEKITYKDILDFYLRVKDSLGGFISDLSENIRKDLYDFDEEKIEEYSHNILLRMNEETIDKLIIKLKEKNYK